MRLFATLSSHLGASPQFPGSIASGQVRGEGSAVRDRMSFDAGLLSSSHLINQHSHQPQHPHRISMVARNIILAALALFASSALAVDERRVAQLPANHSIDELRESWDSACSHARYTQGVSSRYVTVLSNTVEDYPANSKLAYVDCVIRIDPAAKKHPGRHAITYDIAHELGVTLES